MARGRDRRLGLAALLFLVGTQARPAEPPPDGAVIRPPADIPITAPASQSSPAALDVTLSGFSLSPPSPADMGMDLSGFSLVIPPAPATPSSPAPESSPTPVTSPVDPAPSALPPSDSGAAPIPAPTGTSTSILVVPAPPVNLTAAWASFMAGFTPVPSPPPKPAPLPIAGCGPVQRYFGQTPADWDKANTTPWLDSWWTLNAVHFAEHPGGFAATLGAQYLSNPDWTCRTDGSSSNCDLNPCTATGLNQAGVDMQPAYLVLESVNRMHSYFIGLGQALQVSSIGAALGKDEWVNMFWNPHKDLDVTIMRDLLIAAAMLVGVAAVLVGPFGVGVATAGGVVATLFGSGTGFAQVNIKNAENDQFSRAAEIGGKLSQIFIQSLKDMITGNNLLMGGQDFSGAGDIRTFLAGGGWASYPGLDQVLMIDRFTAMLEAVAINALWRQQKVFILGGGPCDDSGGTGHGPQKYKVCRDNRAWYLYFWEELGHMSLNMHRWGWISPAPGADKFGKGEFQNTTIADVINSSLDAWSVAGYNYTYQLGRDQALKALQDGAKAPGLATPAWEGTFTIPICDVSGAAGFPHADQILMDFDGWESRPRWCGPICSNDQITTDAWIRAANMQDFQSPTKYCPMD